MDASEEVRMFVPTGKKYSDMIRHTTDMIDNFNDAILLYAEKALEYIEEDPIVIADYCTADGKSSFSLIQMIIGLIREKTKKEIMVVYEDQIGNDYNILFKQVLKGEMLSFSGVFVMASSTTMYKQCLPSNSARFIFCFNGLYYLSKRRCLKKHGMVPIIADEEEIMLYKRQAEADWKLFLSKRSKELKPGGFMFIIPSAVEQGGVQLQLNITLNSLLVDNIISEVEFLNISLNAYPRSELELRQPFKENAEEVRDLELVSCAVIRHTIFEVDSGGSVGKEKAEFMVEFTRTFAYNPIFDHLSEERTIGEKQRIIDEFFKRFVINYQQLKKDVICEAYPRLVIQKKI